jgi:flagellar motor switch protein FliN/FliY
MPPINSTKINGSMASFLDALTGELKRLLSADQTEPVTVSWDRDRQDSAGSDSADSDSNVSDLIWWSCALSVDPACRIAAGADRTTWTEIGDADTADAGLDNPQEPCFAVLTQSIEHAAKTRFGALVTCADVEISGESPNGWARVPVTIGRGGTALTMYLSISPDLAAALGGEDQDNGAAQISERNARTATSSLEILKHVEIPVSVSFGRTQMLLKDLLRLANGSVVPLDRELGDEVEIRVNNCVIARGEVVAVDGNYGVRILEIASSPGSQGVRGALLAN